MRFSLTKYAAEFARDVDPGVFVLSDLSVKFCRSAVEAAEAALLAPGPCSNGCRMCDWVEAYVVTDEDGTGLEPAFCRRCAELERVRQQERAAALEQVKAKLKEVAWSDGLCINSDLDELADSLIPAEAQGTSYPPPRIDGDVLTYAGFRWQKLAVPTVEGGTPKNSNNLAGQSEQLPAGGGHRAPVRPLSGDNSGQFVLRCLSQGTPPDDDEVALFPWGHEFIVALTRRLADEANAGWQLAHDKATCGHPRACYQDPKWPESSSTAECIMCVFESRVSERTTRLREALKVAINVAIQAVKDRTVSMSCHQCLYSKPDGNGIHHWIDAEGPKAAICPNSTMHRLALLNIDLEAARRALESE